MLALLQALHSFDVGPKQVKHALKHGIQMGLLGVVASP